MVMNPKKPVIGGLNPLQAPYMDKQSQLPSPASLDDDVASPFEWVVPGTWRAIEFISDLHLGEHTPKTFDLFRHYLQHTTADAVFILGDLFEVWIGDDSASDGFERTCTEVLTQAAATRTIALMRGNRDFLVGSEWLRAHGLLELPDPAVLDGFGQRVLLTHGDELCLEDRDYQRFRATVRSAEWQRSFLSQPLPLRREQALRIRAESERRKHEQKPETYADLDISACLQWLERTRSTVMINGHTHRPGEVDLAHSRVRHVLSDWDAEHFTPARAEVLRLSVNGIERCPLPPSGQA